MKEAKIKTIAKVIWIVGSIFSALSSVPFFIWGLSVGRQVSTKFVNGRFVVHKSFNAGGVAYIILGIAVLAIGLAISYAIRIIFEAFAELCGDVYHTRRILQNIETREKEKEANNFIDQQL